MHPQSLHSYLNVKQCVKDAAREHVGMLCEQDVWHGSSIKARDIRQYLHLNVTSK